MQHAHVADLGMILDKASTHCSDEVKEHVEKNELSYPTANPPNFHRYGTNINSVSSRCHYHKTTKERVQDPMPEGSVW